MAQKSRQELIVMGVLTLERAQKAEARATSAENDLWKICDENSLLGERLKERREELKAAKTRAEGAEKQLTDTRRSFDTTHMKLAACCGETMALNELLAEAQQQIEWLEKLVPDGDVLERIDNDSAKEADYAEIKRLGAAIRKYREEGK